MKNISYILLSLLLLVCSCTDLNEDILNEKNGSDIVSDSKNAQMIAAPSYAHLRDLQSRSGVWLVVQSLTDEMVFPTRGTDWNNADYRTLFTHEYDSKNSYIRNCFNSFMLGVTKSNTSMLYLSKLEQNDEIKGYFNEVRFIRALCMFHLADIFGQFPMREYDVVDFTSNPEIYDRATAIARVEAELKELIPLLKPKGEISYGRITRAAAQTLLAKLYLNNQVYTGTAPAFTDGAGKWTETIALCDEIINSGKYALADDYWKMFLSNNHTYADQTEAILPIIYDCAKGLSGIPWLNITLHYNQTFNKFTGMWNGCCTTPTFLDTWDTTDPRYQDDRLKSQVGFNLGILIGQQYAADGVTPLKTRTGAGLIYTPDFSVANSSEAQGARVVKYAPDPTSTYPSASENDILYYRLTDIYLMRAEAKLRSNNTDGALQDLNTVRQKRGVKPIEKSELSLESLYKERGYEFYWEGPSRRNDMVRFNKYCGERYQKPSTPIHKILLPIPLSVLEANESLKQNPGYN